MLPAPSECLGYPASIPQTLFSASTPPSVPAPLRAIRLRARHGGTSRGLVLHPRSVSPPQVSVLDTGASIRPRLPTDSASVPTQKSGCPRKTSPPPIGFGPAFRPDPRRECHLPARKSFASRRGIL